MGIEAINVYAGTAYLEVDELAERRGLDPKRVAHLLMREKTVCMPYEDPVTFAVNAARPLLDAMSPEERERIDLVITCTESGMDFGKSLSTYVHPHLGLKGNCRLIEVKQACYSGVAGLQMAANYILAGVNPGAKALVIASDVARFSPLENSDKWFFAELVAGSGGVAFVVGDNPKVFELDIGASGYYGFDVMDTCRPFPDGGGTGDADLSLMSYLDCLDAAFAAYAQRVEDVSFRDSFQHLAFHAPFGGMVKSAHKRLMRNLCRASPIEIGEDFDRRLAPGLVYVGRIGNILGGSMLLALTSTIDNTALDAPRRIGCYSYGSGCCSEFFSGVVTDRSGTEVAAGAIDRHLASRHRLDMQQYETAIAYGNSIAFGVRNATPRRDISPEAAAPRDTPRLHLREIADFHRQYSWS
ncbi:MAG TPA: hydroxymethylglutaryl-CoA synthase [Phenylobacterium sp.]|uniref:hydroxymethylglutaryl-CoA synthase family protein n=1 Tax=Phenylobacterium sp. TaxID=1871053 RepID=UPI002D536A67|nr:hydroxymethylglutaryl-CoA synthase [Phenylobacterium sp.]HZZ67809.1 hydroxymethylglutaryl-CoA synthase [Phenylobacterium sp.]